MLLSQCNHPKMIPFPSLPVLVLQQQWRFLCGISRIIFLQPVEPSDITVNRRFKLIQSHRWCHFSLTIGGNVHFLHDETWNLKGGCRSAATQLKLESWSQMSVSRCLSVLYNPSHPDTAYRSRGRVRVNRRERGLEQRYSSHLFFLKPCQHSLVNIDWIDCLMASNEASWLTVELRRVDGWCVWSLMCSVCVQCVCEGCSSYRYWSFPMNQPVKSCSSARWTLIKMSF